MSPVTSVSLGAKRTLSSVVSKRPCKMHVCRFRVNTIVMRCTPMRCRRFWGLENVRYALVFHQLARIRLVLVVVGLRTENMLPKPQTL